MNEYTVSFQSEWEIWNDDPQDWDAQRAVAAHTFTIVTPVRTIEPYWEDWCSVRTDLYETKTKMDNMRDARIRCASGYSDDDPNCPDVYNSQEYRDEEEAVWNHFREVEAVHFSFVDEDGWDTRFSEPGEMAACSCWCQYTGESICETVPWGTTDDIPEGDGSTDGR